MRIDEIIARKLEEALAPADVQVINQSHLHKGHSGDDGSGESHFKLIVASPVFSGMGRIQRHRLVMGSIREHAAEIHAISIEAYAPDEAH